MSDKIETPELDRQRAIVESGEAGAVQSFLDWLIDDEGLSLAKYGADPAVGPYRLTEVIVDRQRLMATFFGIDLGKIENERRALLDALRKEQS